MHLIATNCKCVIKMLVSQRQDKSWCGCLWSGVGPELLVGSFRWSGGPLSLEPGSWLDGRSLKLAKRVVVSNIYRQQLLMACHKKFSSGLAHLTLTLNYGRYGIIIILYIKWEQKPIAIVNGI